ncbi:3-hydroxyacyl-ACP dehydratase FabZ [Pigmentibacter sp. JX0631]|uniref:3-hydroxyacyl-ACP dehydratase FabZ n=1 Tax=Pigmentibacter sp. JX0631 TaxID=2976982 RepID=UPI0024684AF4|nr:3-hydroxyacyl-ACP dehydratase FabZ [Pigmentibacter sp. JX0631]WGL61161.1 3-hydroxyacyl-ACP dehydratase FabZ [Pigmentibacter sp. JX0631]
MDNIFDKIAMSMDDIKKVIPHRDPLLLIDCVHEINLGKNIITSKLLTKDDPVFRGHFPENPIYPGVYYLEALAQSGAVLGLITRKEMGIVESNIGFLSSIDDVRFRKPGTPGNRIKYEVAVDKMRGPFLWLKGKAYINDEVAVECSLSMAIAPQK